MSAQTLKDIGLAWSVTLTSLTLAEIHLLFGITAMATATGYTVWKWHRDIKNKK